MVLLAHIFFWVSAFLLVHTYVIYPIILRLLSSNRKDHDEIYSSSGILPEVYVLMAAHNEEAVIEQKMATLLQQKYNGPIKIYIGSDNSSDRTNEILLSFEKKYQNIDVTYFKERQGKPSIINRLAQKAAKESTESILLLTDASVMLKEDTLYHLVKHFKDERIGLVDACMRYQGMNASGISQSEDTYLTREVNLKNQQSRLNRKMLGPFGGCFAMRAELYHPIPDNFLVDDFYLAMKVIDAGYDTINDLEAICLESVSHDIAQELKRKRRMSAGNFQNLREFFHLLNPFSSLGFSFLSHKVLRWLGPIFMIFMVLSSVALSLHGSLLYQVLLSLLLFWFFFPWFLDLRLAAMGINVKLVRNIKYFNAMNWALFLGLIDYLKGVKTNVWEPTART